ncbi:MAG: beta-mannosidase [Paracoccaceae bacterium]
MTNLNGEWDFRDQSGEYRLGITLPGDAISALFDADLIPDPYWGRNEYDLRWIAERDWIASRRFTLENDACDLVLSGLDTIVDVKVNGQVVLQAQNAFRTYRIDLTGIGKAGENEIELHFRSSVTEGAEQQKNQPFFIPYSVDNCPIPNGNMMRKAQCDFGWDWNIALAPFGVLGGISVEPHCAIRIDGILVDQQHCDGAVDVTIDLLFNAAEPGATDYAVELCGQIVTGKADHTSGSDRLSVTLRIENPDLWWPAGSGAQPLHDLTVTLGSSTTTRRIGLRNIELIVEDDAAGTGFKFRVNDRDIFAKGANWIPADALSGRITKDGVRDLLQSAVDANMNMIRIWGGGRYEPTWFYDICDQLGLMIWQDFMFACNLYPADDAFLTEVTTEVHDNVTRLNHHACLALWCGDNELIGALNWFEISRNNRDRYLVMYDRLNRTIEAALKDITPQANWWPSSPSPGYMNFGDAWHDDSSGDMHFWSVWHENKDFDHYRDVNPRFCSEFGFQSYPSNNIVKTFAGKADRNIAAPVLESHQKNKGGNERIAGTMFRYFRFPVDFENFVYLSQVQQGLAIKTAVEYWRSLKPHCMGALIWQLNDTWPVCSWSSLDYGGGWKLLHHMAKEFNAPIRVVAYPKDGQVIFRGINDSAEPVETTLQIRAVKTDGSSRDLPTVTCNIGPDAAETVTTLDADSIAADEFLVFTWSNSDNSHGMDHLTLNPYKTFDLLAPEISTDISKFGDNWQITLSASKPAFFTAIETDQPGRFSDNGFLLMPGHPRHIIFAPQQTGPKPEFTLRDLHSATYEAAK